VASLEVTIVAETFAGVTQGATLARSILNWFTDVGEQGKLARKASRGSYMETQVRAVPIYRADECEVRYRRVSCGQSELDA